MTNTRKKSDRQWNNDNFDSWDEIKEAQAALKLLGLPVTREAQVVAEWSAAIRRDILKYGGKLPVL